MDFYSLQIDQVRGNRQGSCGIYRAPLTVAANTPRVGVNTREAHKRAVRNNEKIVSLSPKTQLLFCVLPVCPHHCRSRWRKRTESISHPRGLLARTSITASGEPSSVVNSPLRLASYTSRPVFHDASFEGHPEVQPDSVPFDRNFSGLSHNGNNPLWERKKPSRRCILRVVHKSGVYRFACRRRDFRFYNVAHTRSVPTILTKTQ